MIWKRFYFESNRFFDFVDGMADWQRLRDAYSELTDDEILDAHETTCGMTLGQNIAEDAAGAAQD